MGPWRAWRLLVQITAAAPRSVCFHAASASVGPLAAAHERHDGSTLEPGPKRYPQQPFSSWEPVACVSPPGGEEGSFGEQLEKLNQNLDGNGIQGSFLAPCTKRGWEEVWCFGEPWSLWALPEKPRFALGSSAHCMLPRKGFRISTIVSQV